jgi:hypothetical protein
MALELWTFLKGSFRGRRRKSLNQGLKNKDLTWIWDILTYWTYRNIFLNHIIVFAKFSSYVSI